MGVLELGRNLVERDQVSASCPAPPAHSWRPGKSPGTEDRSRLPIRRAGEPATVQAWACADYPVRRIGRFLTVFRYPG
jgi:hypothetical protein